MDERDFRWYEGKHEKHPDACTCPVCCEKRKKKEEKEKFGGKIECPVCGYLSVNWVERLKQYVCSNPDCGISGQTLFELSHGVVTLPPRSETEIPKSPPRSETQIPTSTIAPQKERRQKRTSSTLVRVLLRLVLIVVIVVALLELVPGLKTGILNIAAEMGVGDRLALNPAAESYLHQTWAGQTINLPAEGTFELGYDDISGQHHVHVYSDGRHVTVTNHQNVHNPTMAELKAFLKRDYTENYVYSAPSFVCTNYAVTLHNNAEANGIRCAFVSIYGADPKAGHALNAFQTTDAGLVFVDDTNDSHGTGIDKFAKITIGQKLSEVPVFRSDFLVHVYAGSTLGPVSSGEMWW